MTECIIPDCSKKRIGSHGWCSKHYTRNRRHGSPFGGGSLRVSKGEPQRWIDANKEHGGDECLIWPYGRDKDGYGRAIYDGLQQGVHSSGGLLLMIGFVMAGIVGEKHFDD